MARQKKDNKKEILWNVVNSLLAGGLIFLGALSDGNISSRAVIAALITAAIVCIGKFNDYWKKEEVEYRSRKFFSFV